MPQAKIDTGGFEMKDLKKAAAKAFNIVARKGTYKVYYSIITHKVHIVAEAEEVDPDWLLCEDTTPFAMQQQAIADIIAEKLQKFTENIVCSGGLQKLIDES